MASERDTERNLSAEELAKLHGGPDAEVPVTHSDKVHGSENWEGVQAQYHSETTAKLDTNQTDDVLLGRAPRTETFVAPPKPETKKKMSRLKRNIGLGAAIAVFGGAGVAGITANALGGGGPVPQNPGVGGPEAPGATGEVVSGGVRLDKDQIEAMNSGDPERIMEVMDATLVLEIQDYFNKKLDGDSPSVENIASDETIGSALDNAVQDIDTATAGQGDREVLILPTTPLTDPTMTDERYLNRPSVMEEGQPLVIQATTNTMDGPLDGTSTKNTFPGITVNFTGSSIELVDL